MKKKYQTVALGGTFDHFHLGHEHFLKFAAQMADHLIIGVSAQDLIPDKVASSSLEDFKERRHRVEQFLTKAQSAASLSSSMGKFTFELVKLNDIFGPTLADTQAQAIIVTPDTLVGAQKINQKRLSLGLAELPVEISDYVLDQSGLPIHSTRIRLGQIDRNGLVFERLFDHDLKLSEKQRQYFSQPQGQIVTQDPSKSDDLVWVVGDVSLEHFLTHHWPFSTGVFDQKRYRELVKSTLIDQIKPDIKAINPSGIISLSLIKALKNCLAQNLKYLQVEGEEDLAAVVLVLLAPLGTKIYYGQPHQGLVMMAVSEELKTNFHATLFVRNER